MNCTKCKKEIPDGSTFCMYCGNRLTAKTKSYHYRTRGTGCITKLSGKRRKPYWARIGDIKLGCYETKKEAELALQTALASNLSSCYNYTFAECFSSWFPEHEATLKARNIANGHPDGNTSGMSGYKVAFGQCSQIHNVKLRDLHTVQMQAIIDSMQKAGYSASSADKVKQLCSQLFKWGIKERIVSTNMAEFITVVPDSVARKSESSQEIFSKDDIQKLQDSDLPAAKITLLLLATGARLSELFCAKTSDCTEDYIVGGVKTSNGRNRIMPVASLAIDEYRQLFHTAQKNHCERLIEAIPGNNDARNWRKRDYYPMLDQLGISRKTPHATRHTFITTAVDSGVAPEDLKEIAGHASYSTTIDKYTHKRDDDLVEAIKKIIF